MGAGEVLDAEVAADRGDDVGDGLLVEVVVEVGVVQALAKLGVQRLRLGAVGPALDGVLDRADDLLAGCEAALGASARLGQAGAGSVSLRARAMVRRRVRAMRSKAMVGSGAGTAVGLGPGAAPGATLDSVVAWRWTARARSAPISISSWRTWR